MRKRSISKRPSQAPYARALETTNAQSILAMIGEIPAGQVATYGQIAALAGLPNNARQVGAIMRALPRTTRVPWYRVVNSQGRISQRGGHESESRQRIILENEGIEFGENGRIDLATFRWAP